jgi:hypothetical protein
VEPIYAKIAGEAIELWKSELFTGTYHQTGIPNIDLTDLRVDIY